MTQPIFYVGIGASAGGLEAIEHFFKTVPADTGFAFIVIQHLSPDYKSLMVELLSKKTELPVCRAEDGMEVEANRIYLIPPKKNLYIFHGKLVLNEQDTGRGINLPIDIFLRSLAEDQGEKAVAVILSGTGSDGMRGVRAIKEHGGMVMVQDEESAKFDGMPRAALSTGLADFVLHPEKMPEQLIAFSKRQRLLPGEEVPPTDKTGLLKLFAAIKTKTKVDFTFYKPSTVHRRIERRMTVNQMETLDQYNEFMQRFPAEIMALYKELLIGVTSFFRDQEAFDFLASDCLPSIFDSAMGNELRFWVAGCSTGEEAYSLAILIKEHMEAAGIRKQIKIFATDLDSNAIQFAATGSYPESVAADIPHQYLIKYFHKNGDAFQISRNLREMVVFARHNLINDPPFTNIDLITCRNLLIYLQPVVQKKVFEFFNFSLRPGGMLFLGSSEATGECSHFFETIQPKFKFFKSKGIQRQLRTDMKPFPYNGLPSLDLERHGTMRRDFSLNPGADERIFERFLHTLADDALLPLSVIVNESLEILHVFGNTEGYFKLPSGRISSDITALVRKELAIPVASSIQRVFKTGEEQKYTLRLENNGEPEFTNLHVRMVAKKKGQSPLVAVLFSPVVEEQKIDGQSIIYDLSKETEERIKDLESELQLTKENLQATIEELETSNEELQATNEELLASNEELQSTNEELQSTNEELHTVNAEFQNKIFELTDLHNDVENILTSTGIGILLLDENKSIRRFSPPICKIFSVLEQDVGRPFTHLSHNLAETDLESLVREVLASSLTIERTVRSETGLVYQLQIRPYSVGPSNFSGVVMTFVDITAASQIKARLDRSDMLLRDAARMARIGPWHQGADHVQKWHEETCRIFSLVPRAEMTLDAVLALFVESFQPVLKDAFARNQSMQQAIDVVACTKPEYGGRWIRILGQTLCLGPECSLVGVYQDVSELHAMEERLQVKRQDRDDILRHVSMGFLMFERLNGFFVVQDGNQQAGRIIGRAVNELHGQTLPELWSLANASEIEERCRQVIHSGDSYQGEALVRGPEQRDALRFRYSLFSLTAGRVGMFFEPARPFSDTLSREVDIFQRAFLSMTYGAVVQDRDGRIVQCNPAAERILGLSKDTLTGRRSIDPRWRAIHPDGSPFPGEEHPSMIALREGRDVQGVVMGVFNPHDNQTRWVLINAYPLFEEGAAAPHQVFATFEDISVPLRQSAEQSVRTREV